MLSSRTRANRPPATRRVLFLALSGVRIHDPELRALGLSLPAFAARARTIAELPSLGLLTLAGLTPSEWEISYRELDELTAAAVADLLASDFSLVAISALTARAPEAYALADSLRQHGKCVVLGGLHVSAMPDEAALHADAVVVGEAEPVWQQLLDDFAAGWLRQVYRAPASFDFRCAPLPRYDLLDPAHYNRLPIQTTRGCPLDCEFCGASRTISPFKRKPVALIRRDLERILELWPRPFIELADDNTFVDRRWSRELLNLFSDYRLRWFTETDISIADDEALLDMLAESGCTELLIGLESPDSHALAATDSRGWKRRRLESYLSDIAKIQQRGIAVNGCFAIGFDMDTEETFPCLRDFVRESGLARVQVTVLTPFPGTALYHRLKAENRLLAPTAWERFTLFDVVHRPLQMDAEELRAGLKWLTSELYSRNAVSVRTSATKERQKQVRTRRTHEPG